MALRPAMHVMAASADHEGAEIAATLRLESITLTSEDSSAFLTAGASKSLTEATENLNTEILPSPTLEAGHCSSSSQFLSAHDVSSPLSLEQSESSDRDNKTEQEMKASKVHWSELEPCSSNRKSHISELEQEIKASKVHWSELSSSESWSSDGEAAENNQTIFERLRQNPLYQNLFKINFVDVVMGLKIAEGGQAEIFELDYCRTSYENTSNRESEWFDLELPCVLKVFKAGYSLRDLQSQWPQGMLKRNYHRNAVLKDGMEEVQSSDYERSAVNDASRGVVKTPSCFSASGLKMFSNSIRRDLGRKSPNVDFRSSVVLGGVVLKDDRFAFVLQREGVDLRKCIDVFQDENSRKWEPQTRIFGEYLTFHPQRSNKRGVGPVFKRPLALGIIYQIAKGMRELHIFGILHRDLKASNVLISDIEKFPKFDQNRWIQLKVADYECSIGVLGTGFWRAPEILRQLKDPKRKHPVHFTQEADVYSFAMTCYEVLTGSIPLEEYAASDHDVVLGGMRPSLPEDIPRWLRNLITSCWHHDPAERPTFTEIVREIQSHSYFYKDCVQFSHVRNTRKTKPQ